VNERPLTGRDNPPATDGIWVIAGQRMAFLIDWSTVLMLGRGKPEARIDVLECIAQPSKVACRSFKVLLLFARGLVPPQFIH